MPGILIKWLHPSKINIRKSPLKFSRVKSVQKHKTSTECSYFFQFPLVITAPTSPPPTSSASKTHSRLLGTPYLRLHTPQAPKYIQMQLKGQPNNQGSTLVVIRLPQDRRPDQIEVPLLGERGIMEFEAAISSASQSMSRSTAKWWDGGGCWERTFRVDLDEEEVFLSNSPFELQAPAWLVLFPWVTWGWRERLGCFTYPRPQSKNSCHFLTPSLGSFHYLYICKSCSTDPWRATEAPEGLWWGSGRVHCGEGSSPSPREAPPSRFCYTASFSMRLNLIHRLTCHFLKNQSAL